jgi:flagellar biosynthesis GTPase FlhF
MEFTADQSLNGKHKISIESEGATIYVYMMPNAFNTDLSNTYGILENNQIKAKVTSGTYEVPTDWTLLIAYNVGYLDGRVSVRSWAEEYTKADEAKISSEWEPTGTYYVDEEELARIAAEKAALEEQERLEQERIEKELREQEEKERQAAADAQAAKEAQEEKARLEKELALLE